MSQVPIEAVRSIIPSRKECRVEFPPMSEAAFKKFCKQMGWAVQVKDTYQMALCGSKILAFNHTEYVSFYSR